MDGLLVDASDRQLAHAAITTHDPASGHLVEVVDEHAGAFQRLTSDVPVFLWIAGDRLLHGDLLERQPASGFHLVGRDQIVGPVPGTLPLVLLAHASSSPLAASFRMQLVTISHFSFNSGKSATSQLTSI